MTIRETLTSIALTGVLALGIAGCSRDHSQYEFNGKIGEDQVEFIESKNGPFYDNNILIEKKPDGRVIEYGDRLKEDLKLEYVSIAKDGQIIRYTTDNKVVLKKAQENFDTRMKQILEINTNKKQHGINQGLEYLK